MSVHVGGELGTNQRLAGAVEYVYCTSTKDQEPLSTARSLVGRG